MDVVLLVDVVVVVVGVVVEIVVVVVVVVGRGQSELLAPQQHNCRWKLPGRFVHDDAPLFVRKHVPEFPDAKLM